MGGSYRHIPVVAGLIVALRISGADVSKRTLLCRIRYSLISRAHAVFGVPFNDTDVMQSRSDQGKQEKIGLENTGN